MNIAYAQQNETLDHLCHRVLGRTTSVTEQVLQLNPGLADLGATLPEGTPVKLPADPVRTRRIETVQLWS